MTSRRGKTSSKGGHVFGRRGVEARTWISGTSLGRRPIEQPVHRDRHGSQDGDVAVAGAQPQLGRRKLTQQPVRVAPPPSYIHSNACGALPRSRSFRSTCVGLRLRTGSRFWWGFQAITEREVRGRPRKYGPPVRTRASVFRVSSTERPRGGGNPAPGRRAVRLTSCRDRIIGVTVCERPNRDRETVLTTSRRRLLGWAGRWAGTCAVGVERASRPE